VRAFFALFLDVFRASFAQRSLQILVLIGIAIVVFCLGVSFEGDPTDSVLEANAKGLASFRSRGSGLASHRSFIGTDVRVEPPRPAASGDGLPAGFEDARVVEIAFEQLNDVDALVLNWRSFQAAQKTGEWPEAPNPPPELTDADRIAFLEERFADFGYSDAAARRIGASSYLVAVRVDHPQEVRGASRLSIFFGIHEFPLGDASRIDALVFIQSLLASSFAGFVGMLILVSICGGFVPEMLRKGTVDLVLARPIPRVRLLLFQYAAAVFFVLVLTVALFASSGLALAVGAGFFNPSFLLCALTMTAIFAVLQSASVLFGLLTRSSNIAAVGALGIWGASTVVGGLHHGSGVLFRAYPNVRAALEAAYLALPKLADLASLNTVFLARSHLSEEARSVSLGSGVPEIDWPVSAGTTVAFTVVLLALAAWMFRRRDY